jgi:hypothetical protein
MIKGVRLVFPFNPTLRVTNQSGVFTIHGEPCKDLRELSADSYKPEDCDIESGGYYRIEKENKNKILSQLERIGMTRRILMPELDGVADGLWQSALLRTDPI